MKHTIKQNQSQNKNPQDPTATTATGDVQKEIVTPQKVEVKEIVTPKKVELKEKSPLIKVVVIDTITGLIDQLRISNREDTDNPKYVGQDQGLILKDLVSFFKTKGFEIIIVMGHQGSGKTFGLHTLPMKSFVYFNTDFKTPAFMPNKNIFGTKEKPKYPYHVVPKSPFDIKRHINDLLDTNQFATNRYVFLLGHMLNSREQGGAFILHMPTPAYKSEKVQIEKDTNIVLISKMVENKKAESVADRFKYIFQTAGSGAKTPHYRNIEDKLIPIFPEEIPLNYTLLMEQLDKKYISN